MFLNRNKKNNVYPCKSQFYYNIKVGLRGSTLYRHVFVMSYLGFVQTRGLISLVHDNHMDNRGNIGKYYGWIVNNRPKTVQNKH